MPNTTKFPLPNVTLKIDELAIKACQNDAQCKNENAAKFIVSDVDKDKNFAVDFTEAFSFVTKTKFGHSLNAGTIPSYVFKAVQNEFFFGSAFDGKHATFQPLEVKVESFTDGDTAKAVVKLNIFDIKIKVRLNGIDTPESVRGHRSDSGQFEPNPKLEKFSTYSWLYFREKNGIWPNDEFIVKRMAEDRIVYLGELAGIVTKGMARLARKANTPFTLELTYIRGTDDPAVCNTLNLIDVYDRYLARFKIGSANTTDNLLAGFIENSLPEIMAMEGMKYYKFYHDGIQNDQPAEKLPWALSEQAKKLLGIWKDDPKKYEVYSALSPDTLPDPAKMFSKEKCAELAREWRMFSAKYPDYKNDIQAMLVFLGLAYTYPKYRVQHTDVYLEAEMAAMTAHSTMQGVVPHTHGLWESGDTLFKFMQPNPKLSPLFKRFEKELSGDKPLLPPDCCNVIEDKYRHCR